jgi:hypothetical protein
MTETGPSEPSRIPDVAELGAALDRYFAPGFTPQQVAELHDRMCKLLADDPRRRGHVSLFYTANQIGWGDAWSEEGAFLRMVPSPLDHAILLAATTPGLPRPLPYTPPDFVGTWRLEARADGKPVDGLATWQLAHDGSARATGYHPDAIRWRVHRTGLRPQLWIETSSRSRPRSFLVAVQEPDRLELVPPTGLATRDRWRRC